ncbi:hypothetical protein FQN49_001613 [Arthroderma sp. PD_2]|nr:hypothetical protein FQN49_001613 [Arthroderma sp. PD_2]
MSSQSFASTNIVIILRQLRSLCYSNRATSASPFTSSSLPSRFMPFRAYTNHAAAYYIPSNTSTSVITKQWPSKAFYSTATSRTPKVKKKPSLEDASPNISEPTKPSKPKKPQPAWGVQKKALKAKFEEGWKPRKKVSPDTMESIRKLHDMDSIKFSTKNLAEQFKISPEAIRRILKSRWQATEAEEADRRERWEKRKTRIREQMLELGLMHTDRPPKKDLGPKEGLPQHRGRQVFSQRKKPDMKEGFSRGSSPWEVPDDELLDTKSDLFQSSEHQERKRLDIEEETYEKSDPWEVTEEELLGAGADLLHGSGRSGASPRKKANDRDYPRSQYGRERRP